MWKCFRRKTLKNSKIKIRFREEASRGFLPKKVRVSHNSFLCDESFDYLLMLYLGLDRARLSGPEIPISQLSSTFRRKRDWAWIYVSSWSDDIKVCRGSEVDPPVISGGSTYCHKARPARLIHDALVPLVFFRRITTRSFPCIEKA